MLIGRILNTGATDNDAGTFLITEITIPSGEIDLGALPLRHFFDQLKCYVKIPAPAGVTFKVIDQDDSIILKTGTIVPTRTGTSSGSNMGFFNVDKTLRGVFEGTPGTHEVEIVFFKSIRRIG